MWRRIIWGRPSHLVSGRFLVFAMLASAGLGIVAWDAGRALGRPVVVHTEWRKPDWDLADPFERCLAAMEQAEIPGDMWKCYETPQPV